MDNEKLLRMDGTEIEGCIRGPRGPKEHPVCLLLDLEELVEDEYPRLHCQSTQQSQHQHRDPASPEVAYCSIA